MASGGSTAGHGRQEQAARPTLVWAARARRLEVEEKRRPLDGHRRSLQLESFILTKLTKPLVRVNLVAHRSASETVCPRCQGEESFFGRPKLEYPRLKKKHDIRWMDIQRTLLLEPCVDYKLTKPCIRVNLVFVF